MRLKIFFCARASRQIRAYNENADEIRVFIAYIFLFVANADTISQSPIASNSRSEPAARRLAGLRKKLCTGALSRRFPSAGEAQNARIGAKRFAGAAAAATSTGCPRRS
ncbi:MAG TPA: hypothetical protein VMC05_05205 [Xanthobacteraceae bacterium]|nr:hypothetical protein [Xanthobacteraceae bacterium]